jgi:hypothetical protein
LSYVKDADIENASPKAKLLPVNQSFVSEYEPVTRGTKRNSDQDSYLSSKYVRPQKQQRQQLSLENHISYKISAPNSSHASTNQTNTASVYPGDANQSFATTVATSFNSVYDEWDSSSADYGDDPDPSQAAQIEQILTSFEQPACDPQDSGVVNNSFSKCGPSLDDQSLSRPSFTSDRSKSATSVKSHSFQALALKVPSLNKKATSTTKILEHRLVRTLPTDGLFSSPVAISVDHSSFHHLWESYRFAEATGRPFKYYANEDELYQNIPAGHHFQRTPVSVWDATTDPLQFANVILKANLTFNSSASADKLLALTLQPLKCERACVLQRRFGSSRFLYVEVLQVHTFNGIHLKGQQDLLKSRFREWMCTGKEFLGRIWRVFHVQDVKKKNSKDNLPSQRLVLFAVDGPRLQKISLYEVLNWAIPLNKNGHQGFCKAYARLDLFLSQTIPTVKFNSQRGQVCERYSGRWSSRK